MSYLVPGNVDAHLLQLRAVLAPRCVVLHPPSRPELEGVVLQTLVIVSGVIASLAKPFRMPGAQARAESGPLLAAFLDPDNVQGIATWWRPMQGESLCVCVRCVCLCTCVCHCGHVCVHECVGVPLLAFGPMNLC